MKKYQTDPILAKLLSRVCEDFAKAFLVAMFATPLFDKPLPVEEYGWGLLKGSLIGILFLILAWQLAKLAEGNKK